jgi:N-acetylglucosaminyldiphosphoundecaprenol N-acetyl-beta-D-mannosaminyltransferase
MSTALRKGTSNTGVHIDVLGSTVHLKSTDEAVNRIETWIADPQSQCRQIVVSGFHALWEAHRNEQVRRAVRSADLWLPDGIAPVWAARLQGMKGIERVTGADLMTGFLVRANEHGFRSFFYGDTDETLFRLKLRLQEKYPNHLIVGALSPPFRALTGAEDEAIIATINAAKPDVLWVGLGTPKQDCWIAARRDRLRVPVAAGVGAAFQFLAGSVSRCPEWIGRAGLEWAYRLTREPKKLWRRDLIDGPRFLIAVSAEIAADKLGLSRKSRVVGTF